MIASRKQIDPQHASGEILHRRCFGLSRDDCDMLLGLAEDGQDRLNDGWAALGRRHGFVWTTVREMHGGDITRDELWMFTAEVEKLDQPEPARRSAPSPWVRLFLTVCVALAAYFAGAGHIVSTLVVSLIIIAACAFGLLSEANRIASKPWGKSKP
jgi:hypothetical protein